MLIANQLTDYSRLRHGEKYSNRLQLMGLLLQRDGWTNVFQNNKEVDREASLFQTANIVINHFMSSEDMSNFPLRRIQDNIMNGNVDFIVKYISDDGNPNRILMDQFSLLMTAVYFNNISIEISQRYF